MGCPVRTAQRLPPVARPLVPSCKCAHRTSTVDALVMGGPPAPPGPSAYLLAHHSSYSPNAAGSQFFKRRNWLFAQCGIQIAGLPGAPCLRTCIRHIQSLAHY